MHSSHIFIGSVYKTPGSSFCLLQQIEAQGLQLIGKGVNELCLQRGPD